MPLDSQPPDNPTHAFEHRANNAIAFMVSLVVHVSFLLILACVAYQVGRNSNGLLLTAEYGETTQSSLDLLQTFELAPQYNEPQQPATASPEMSINFELDNVFDKSAGVGTAAALTSVSVGEVIESLDVRGSGRGASFFGTYAEGNRFVYVLDSSRSMRGDRWTYACNQLIDSLNALKPGQEFFVICFDLETSYLFNLPPKRAQFFEADSETLTKVRRWLRGRTLGRATMPAEALRVGLEFNPDAIFLLSDGELQDNSLAVLRSLNGLSSERRQIPIHTVHLFSPQGRMSLELIALENSGTFTHIEGR